MVIPCRGFSERDIATPTVSLERLLAGTAATLDGDSGVRLTDYISEVVASGFPGLRGLPDRVLRGELDSYLHNAVDRDIPEQGLAVRKPAVLLDWPAAYRRRDGIAVVPLALLGP